jgi:hypothetical protein
MAQSNRGGVSRRSALALAGAAAGAGATLAGGGAPRAALAHDLRPDDPAYDFDRYESIVNRDVTFRQLYQWPNLKNAVIFNNIRNGLNGAQFSYGLAADQIQVVVQTYDSANAATYDDFIWAKYRWGEALAVTDPRTNQPAERNIFYPSAIPAADVTPPPTARGHAYYADNTMEGVQRRGVLFLI